MKTGPRRCKMTHIDGGHEKAAFAGKRGGGSAGAFSRDPESALKIPLTRMSSTKRSCGSAQRGVHMHKGAGRTKSGVPRIRKGGVGLLSRGNALRARGTRKIVSPEGSHKHSQCGERKIIENGALQRVLRVRARAAFLFQTPTKLNRGQTKQLDSGR
jgi:hypothetical protein